MQLRRPIVALIAATVALAAALALPNAAEARRSRAYRGTYLVKRPSKASTRKLGKQRINATRQGIVWAQKRISKHMKPTPLVHSPELSKRYGVQVYLKVEAATEVGSFKIRGALNTVLSMPKSMRKNGVVAASTGNHAQGVALAAKKNGIKATIVMPEGASPLKAKKTRKLGAEVVIAGSDYGKSIDIAKQLAKKDKRIFIPGYAHKRVIEGQGTIGREILRQLPDADWVIGAVGGGGLMGGISSSAGNSKKRPLFVGVQSSHNGPMFEALRHRPGAKYKQVNLKKTIADGTLVTKKPNPRMEHLLRERLDLVVKVPEKRAERAVLELLDRTGLRIEGAGALPLAGLDQALKDMKRIASLKKLPKPKKVVLVLSGGNIDQSKLDAIRARHGQQ
jgi:threonine dehydratase